MSRSIVTSLLWFSAIGCGLLAGLYFAFSTFIMTAFSRIEQAQGIAAMNSINAVILRSLFMPLFVATSLTSLVLAIVAVFRWGEAGALAMFAGGLIYFAGMFLCTMLLNVPLNNALAAVDPGSAAAAPVWARFLQEWNVWNHVRTLSSTVALALFIAAIAAR